ncbi:MAG: SpoIIE family protein phosphatase [Candidatus Rifleibacteriota bacterium]
MKQGNWWIRFYLVFALIVMPSLIAHEGLSFLALNRKRVETSNLARQMVRMKNDIATHADDRLFWVYQLSRLFKESADPQSLFEKFESLMNQTGCQLNSAVYSPAGDLIRENFSGKNYAIEEIARVGLSLKAIALQNDRSEYFKSLEDLGKVFGKNFFLPERDNENEYLAQKIFLSDFERNDHFFWLAGNGKMIFFVQIPALELKKRVGLKLFCRSATSEHIAFHFLTGAGKMRSDCSDSIRNRSVFSALAAEPGIEFVETENHLFSRVQIDPDLWMMIDMTLENPEKYSGRLLFAFVCILFFSLIWLKKSGFFSGKIEDLPLLVQIVMLISISAGIPLGILGSVAVNYFTMKKTALIRQKNQEMTGLALNLDRNLKLEQSRCNRIIRQALADIYQRSSVDGKLENSLDVLRQRLGNLYSNGLIMKTRLSDTNSAGNRQLPGASYDVLVSDLFPGDNEIVFNLGKQHLAALNSVVPEELPPDKSYILEMIFQRPLEKVVHDLLLADGTANEAGWGVRRLTLFHQGLKVFEKSFFDHFLLIVLNTSLIQDSYMMRHLQTFIRNDYGVKFYISRDQILLNEQKSLDSYHELSALFSRTSNFPLPEPEIVTFAGQKQLFVGLNGSFSGNFRFCLLYPVAMIDKVIHDEAEMLVYPILTGFVIVILMLLVLRINLLQPVARLHQAARALEKRDSSFRLSEASDDEFAEMAAVFNKSIGEFDELKIASIVQSRLLPAKPLVVEGFSIFGKSIPMIDLGGDYFDYFVIDDDHFALLLGDVAGHGVGASLIMAMAKAGVICAEEVGMDPASVLSRLHQIVFSIKNRVQRKVMTFQYLVVNRKSRQIVYSNAGGCSPVLIDNRFDSFREISHPGAVLGGFKKSAFSNLEISIETGQALILYTDGMVESRNSKGEELGYSGLYSLLRRSYSFDASIYYQQIMHSYRQWLGDAVPGDDMTMIVMVCSDNFSA